MSTDLVIVQLGKARTALAEAKTIQDTKQILDVAAAAEVYARRQGLSEEAIGYAHEIKITALAQLGKLLREMPKAVGGQHGGKTRLDGSRQEPSNATPTLSDIGINKKTSMVAQQLASLPEDTREEIAKREKTFAQIKRQMKEDAKQRKQAAKQAVPESLSDVPARYTLYHAAVSDLAQHIKPDSIDAIITDPPYPQEYLSLYCDLAEFAAYALKPGGSLLTMAGQSYIERVMQNLGCTRQLKYQWMLAYHTPGGQSPQIWQRKVNTFWKPVLWYVKDVYEGDWIGDVLKSAVNDNDKRFHEWGQSETGMADIIDRFTYPGQTVCDPFLGGGTTAVVAVHMNRLFIGADKSHESLDVTKERLGA